MCRRLVGLLLVSQLLLAGCASMPAAPAMGLQRSLYPGLSDLSGDAIGEALDQKLALAAPVSGGLAWLSEAPPGAEYGAIQLSEYHRTGVLEAGLKALRQQPFSGVVSLPTLPQVTDSAPSPRTLEALRSASAKFQQQVALLLQTGTSSDSGLNPLALGYLGLLTIPLLPGTDVAVASSAELCAVDVRSGIMLGCARGRATARDRFVAPISLDSRRQQLAEQTLRESVDTAARDLLSQVSLRLAQQ
jgi:hypothetical protein